MDLGYQKAEDSLRLEGWRDNWIQTFRRNEVPDFSPEELKMIKRFAGDGEYTKVAIYLTEDKFGYGLDMDLAEYIIRKLIRGEDV